MFKETKHWHFGELYATFVASQLIHELVIVGYFLTLFVLKKLYYFIF